MSDLPQKDSLDDVTVEPLTDEALEAVSGGATDPESSNGLCCSCNFCSSEPAGS